jgi:hypothetical protein
MALSSLQSFTLSSWSSVSTNCDNGFFVSVLGSRGPHRTLWPSLRNSCSTKLLCAKSNSAGGVSTSAPAVEEQSPPIISLRFIGVSEKNLCTTLNCRKMFSQQSRCLPSVLHSISLAMRCRATFVPGDSKIDVFYLSSLFCDSREFLHLALKLGV